MIAKLVLSTAVAACLIGSSLAQGRLGNIRVGEPFPDLVFPSAANGKPMSIADFAGSKVVLQVFASW